jgi:phosphatidylinositol dimannoside acyltransferase
MAVAAAWFGWQLRLGSRRTMLRNMLAVCDGDKRYARREGRGAYHNIARYWVDLLTLPYRNMATFERDHLTIVDPGGGLRILGEPGPVIAVSAHTGNGELAVQALTYRGRPFVALVEELQPPELMEYMLRLRSSAGGRFVTADFGGVRDCLETLRDGGMVALMGDRDIQGTGLCVDFCGRHIKLPRGPWELARRTNALIMPIFSARGWRDDFTVYVDEPFRVARSKDAEADIRAAVIRWAGLLEAHLKRQPGQWIVLEDFWKRHACAEG